MKTTAILLFMLLLTGFTGKRILPDTKTFTFGHENVLGTSLDLKIKAVSANVADKAEEIALREIDRLDNILSSYKTGSEFSQWQRTLGQDVKVSVELFEVLTLFDQWKLRTDGALSPAAGVAVTLWKKAEAAQKLPEQTQLESAISLMNQYHWSLNADAQTAKHLSKEPLLLNSFVKSYIISKAAEQIMTVPGVTGCIVNIGGDMVVSGDQVEWIRVADPKADEENSLPLSVLRLENRAIATSGSYRRGYTIDNKWYSHVLDVRTALPVSGVISATVIAPNADDAGALATAFNILDPKESGALAREIPGVAYQIVTVSGERIESEEWHLFQPSKTIAPALPRINGQFELTVELELARFEGRFRRPFVAVWLEDAKKEPVRTLALWFNKPRWLPDLKRWYSKNQEGLYDSNSSIASISSATRSPGRYALKWDGLNDEGKMVPPGKYTLYLEAAREHGTYQLIRQDIEWNGKVKHLTLQGGAEITAATVDIKAVSEQ